MGFSRKLAELAEFTLKKYHKIPICVNFGTFLFCQVDNHSWTQKSNLVSWHGYEKNQIPGYDR